MNLAKSRFVFKCKTTETCSFKYKSLRFLSTKEVASTLKKDDKVNVRKYLKPLSTPELKRWSGNFVENLFIDSFDKRIFQYPSVLRDESIDVVLNHSSNVERFIKDNSICLASEDSLQKLRELELFGLSIPQKYGGAGYNDTETKFLLECTGVNPALGRFLCYNEDFGSKLLNYFGNEKQKEKYLSRLAEGKSFISLAYIENYPLIDLSKFEGYAVFDQEKNHYVLNAKKKWVRNADKSDLFLVMVKTLVFEEYESQLKFKMFIVEKNSPGVTVHKPSSKIAEETNTFEVVFEKVCVPQENVLGNEEVNGFEVLKFGLTHCHITDATLSLSIMKELIYNAVQFIHEKNLNDTSVKGYGLIQENLTSLTIFTYALESVVYLLTGRFDLYENPNLFDESVLAKVLTVEFLNNCIQKYIKIVGYQGLIKSGVLEKAVKALQYSTVFDENIENLKLVVASEGLISSAPLLSQKVSTFRKPYDNYKSFLKEIFKLEMDKFRSAKPKHNFKMEFHSSLSGAADSLENACNDFRFTVVDLLINQGSTSLNSEHVIIKLAEMAAYIYAAVACLSRANLSICYNFENFDNDALIAKAFVNMSQSKVRNLLLEETGFHKFQEFYRVIGKTTFINGNYPAEHPLTRTF